MKKRLFAAVLTAVLCLSACDEVYEFPDEAQSEVRAVPDAPYLPQDYSQCSDTEKAAYLELREAVNSCADSFAVPADVSDKVLLSLMREDPLIFNVTYTWNESANGAPTMYFVYTVPADVNARMQAKLIETVEQNAERAQGLDTYTKLLFYHKTIINTANPDENTDVSESNPYTCMVKRNGSKMAYAKVFSMFCEYGGIETDIVSGNSLDPKDTDIHTWNRVNIDGTYYNIDTWSDDINGRTPLNFHRYFCRSDSYMARTNDSSYPADDDSLNFYDVNGLVVTDTKSFYELFNQRAKWAVSNGSNNFELAFSSKALLENTVENKELLLDTVYRFNQDMGELTKKYDFRNYEEKGLCVWFYM